MSICLFQGTFNPIHNAHIRIAEYVLSNNFAESILFIPAYNPPHKDLSSDVTPYDRYNMVNLTIDNNDKFMISDIEYKRGGKSYTYLTIKELQKIFDTKEKFKFIIGTDAFVKIESWYEAEKLKNEIDFLLFKRDKNIPTDKLNILKSKGYNYKLMDLEFKDISSTDIRDRILLGKQISDLVPEKVEEYIVKNDLYKY